MYFNSIIIK